MNAFEVKYLQESIEDHVGMIKYWPKSYRELMLGNHLNFNQRFKLTTFLLANRLDPRTIADWYVYRGLLRDTAAKVHVAQIIRSHKKGELEKFEIYVMNATTRNGDAASEYKFEDGTIIAQGEKQPLIAPAFANYEDSEWDQAYQQLTNKRIF